MIKITKDAYLGRLKITQCYTCDNYSENIFTVEIGEQRLVMCDDCLELLIGKSVIARDQK